jgi:3'(2'), 5'-bisphosphate nucleotidase
MYETELKIGIHAVKTAMRMTKLIQKDLSSADAITKSDKSPVTIADFLSQAIICHFLNDELPNIPIVGEEDSAALKEEKNKAVLEKIYYYIDQDPEVAGFLDKDNLFDKIDLGGKEPGGTFWTLDPIDGTKGFLRGEQFAIALGLIVDGHVKVGILGCPNLSLQENHTGCLVYAIAGEGSFILDSETGQPEKISISSIQDPKNMRFVESYVSAHSNMDMQLKIAKTLNIGQEPVQMDSQVKYSMVSGGKAEIYLRIPHPKTPNYKEKIWDHAAGSLIVEEAGGIVSDIFGKKLDFSAGKTLANNSGILASVPCIHEKIVATIGELRN